jgi:hypothetical protein
MTSPAQHYFIIGAMCIDEQFRNDLFAEGEAAVAPTSDERIAQLLKAYASKYEVVLDDDDLADNVASLVRGPCRVATLEKLTALKAAACPCWPC